jgi:hypothetical protein
MSTFAKTLNDRVEGYIELRRSLGYAFKKQATILRALARYVEAAQLDGPLTRNMAMNFIFSREGTPNCRAIHHGILRRFCEYLAIYDPQTEALDPRALPRSRAIPPPRRRGLHKAGISGRQRERFQPKDTVLQLLDRI